MGQEGIIGPCYDWQNRVIYYDPEASPAQMCKHLIHETAHDIQAHRRVGKLRYGVERYDGNRRSVQHLVASALDVEYFRKRRGR
jgi:hypothetical protein